MKRLLAILFLALLLFNLAGYRLYFYYVQQKADALLQAALDDGDYVKEELLVIRVPLSLPYQSDWNEFERVNGEIDVNGETYKYVKRKVSNGQLILLCLPDHHKTKLENAKEEFFKLVNSMQTQSPVRTAHHPGKLNFFNLFSEFDRQQTAWSLQSCAGIDKVYAPFLSTRLIAPTIPAPTQPPEHRQA